MGGATLMASRASLRAVNVATRKATSEQTQQVRWSGAMAIVKNRMKSVKNIAKITKAQQMVATSKLKGAEKRVAAARPLSAAMQAIFASLETAEAKSNVTVVPMTSDKGLCGGVNSQILKKMVGEIVPELEAAGVEYKVVVVGEKGRSNLRRQLPDKIDTVFSGISIPTFSAAACVADTVLDTGAESVTIGYNKFVSAISQEPTFFSAPTFGLISGGSEVDPFNDFEIEDERGEVLESFAEFNLAVSLYGAMLENQCSEIAARMAAMDNATRNAEEAYDKLELKYNRARQAAITTELIEIISGAESLKG